MNYSFSDPDSCQNVHTQLLVFQKIFSQNCNLINVESHDKQEEWSQNDHGEEEEAAKEEQEIYISLITITNLPLIKTVTNKEGQKLLFVGPETSYDLIIVYKYILNIC